MIRQFKIVCYLMRFASEIVLLSNYNYPITTDHNSIMSLCYSVFLIGQHAFPLQKSTVKFYLHETLQNRHLRFDGHHFFTFFLHVEYQNNKQMLFVISIFHMQKKQYGIQIENEIILALINRLNFI